MNQRGEQGVAMNPTWFMGKAQGLQGSNLFKGWISRIEPDDNASKLLYSKESAELPKNSLSLFQGKSAFLFQER